MQIPHNKRREEVATVIRSCLIARQGDVTVRMLDRDYEEFEGEPIPFREFNCPSLLVFLNQLRNTLRIESKNGQIIVHSVDSEKSRHIASLVEGQRSNKSDRRLTRRPYLGFAGGRTQVSINSLLLIELIRHIKQCQRGLSFDWAIRFVNQFLRPVEITRPELERQLREISHEIAIFGDFLYPANRMPIPLRCSFNYNYPRFNQSSQSDMQKNFRFPNDRLETISNRKPDIRLIPKSNCEKEPLSIVEKSDKMYKNDEVRFMPAGCTLPSELVSTVRITKPVSPSQNEKESLGNGCKDPHNNKKNFEGQEIFNEKRQSLEETRNSSSENQDSPREVQLTKNDEDCKYKNFSDKKFEEDLSGLIKVSTKIRLSRLIHQYPDGIWCTDLPRIYIEEYNTPLIYSELGFSSIVDFVSHLPKIFHCVRPTNAEDYKLYNAAEPPPDLRNETQHTNPTSISLQRICDQPVAFPDKLDSSTSRRLLPEGVMGIGESVGPISITDLGEEGYEEVEISNVLTPSFFWIQLRKKMPKFRKFMDELDRFYEENKSKYKIPIILLERGLNVICFSEEKWQRGIIKEVFQNGRTTIHLYDCGKEVFSSDDIYFLHRSFSYLPTQAIPCGLFNVKPYQSSKWSKEITWEFVSKTSIPLVASIGTIDVQENSMLIILTDTRGEVDFHINDWMYEEKFAEQGQIFFKNQNFAFLYYKECLEKKGYDPLFIHNIRSKHLESDKYENCSKIIPAELKPKELRQCPLRLQRTQALLAQYQTKKETEFCDDPASQMKVIPNSLKSQSSIENLKKFLMESNSKSEDSAVLCNNTINDSTSIHFSLLLEKPVGEESAKREQTKRTTKLQLETESSLPELASLKPIKQKESIQKPEKKVSEEEEEQALNQPKKKEQLPPQIRRLLELQSKANISNS